jgi:phosphatidylserine decarboxylase
MVRITLPHRLKSYTGSNSASNSRSTSPSPGIMKRHTGGSDTSPENTKTNGLALKVVVMKVGFCQLSIGVELIDGYTG